MTESGLDHDLPQLPVPGTDEVVAEQAREVNELVRHLWNALHGLNATDSSGQEGAELSAARFTVHELRRHVQEHVEALPTDYARQHHTEVIAVYSLLR